MPLFVLSYKRFDKYPVLTFGYGHPLYPKFVTFVWHTFECRPSDKSLVALALVMIFFLTTAGNVKKVIVTLLVLAATLQVNAQATQVLFVKAGAQGNGTSWNSSMDLQTALQTAKYGTTIWVASGVYTPTRSYDRNATFHIKDGIILLGGFAGNETSEAQRNPAINVTTLSGNIGNLNIPEDNVYNVVYTQNVKDVRVDGFVISGGYANVTADKGIRYSTGAGWFNEAVRGGFSAPIISNCTFSKNTAFFGAGLANISLNDGTNQAKVFNCNFNENAAVLEGGAILSFSNQSVCNVEISNCNIIQNFASYGAGIYSEAINSGTTCPRFLKNNIDFNKASSEGGSFFATRVAGSVCNPQFSGNNVGPNNSSFVGNDIMIQKTPMIDANSTVAQPAPPVMRSRN